jgi:hypothetical protein
MSVSANEVANERQRYYGKIARWVPPQAAPRQIQIVRANENTLTQAVVSVPGRRSSSQAFSACPMSCLISSLEPLDRPRVSDRRGSGANRPIGPVKGVLTRPI